MRNVLSAIQLHAKIRLRALRDRIDGKEWTDIPPTRINAIHKLSTNEISTKRLLAINYDLFVSLQLFQLLFFKHPCSTKMHPSKMSVSDIQTSSVSLIDISTMAV